MNYRKLLAELRVDEKTVVEFFVAFSRFEFALKQAGYLKGATVKPNPTGTLSQRNMRTNLIRKRNLN